MPALPRQGKRIKVCLLEQRCQAFEYKVAPAPDFRNRFGQQLIQVLLAVVFQIEAKTPAVLFHIGALAGEHVEHSPDDVAISLRVNSGDFEEQPFSGFAGVQGLPPR